jgi:dynein heavy chain
LSSQIVQIFNEFNSALRIFATIKYDILNLESQEFQKDLDNFHKLITDLENRISTILNQAFDDCVGLYSCFRLLESFGGLLNRDNIVRDFEHKYFDLLKIYSQDLDDVSTIFLKNKEHCPIHYNMAPVTGSISWIHELKDRIGKAMEKLKTVQVY